MARWLLRIFKWDRLEIETERNVMHLKMHEQNKNSASK